MLNPNQRQVAPKNSHLITGPTSARVALKDNVLLAKPSGSHENVKFKTRG
jgi:hypothetical protein